MSDERERLIRSYNDYFIKESVKGPYKLFFEDGFERVLQNLPEKASYGYHVADNTAIHIDYETALATTKIWTAPKEKFSCAEEYKEFQEVKKMLRKNGNRLYNKLLAFLDPEVILISNSHLRKDVIEKKHDAKQLGDVVYLCGKKSFPRVSYNDNGKLVIYGQFGYRPFERPEEPEGKKQSPEQEARFLKRAFELFERH